MIDPTTLDELERLAKAATPGPWNDGCGDMDPEIECDIGGCVLSITEHGNANTVARTGEPFNRADKRLVILLRNHADALIREAREAARLREALNAAKAIARDVVTSCPCDDSACDVCRKLDGILRAVKGGA